MTARNTPGSSIDDRRLSPGDKERLKGEVGPEDETTPTMTAATANSNAFAPADTCCPSSRFYLVMFTRTCVEVVGLPATSVDTAVRVCAPCRLGRIFQVNP